MTNRIWAGQVILPFLKTGVGPLTWSLSLFMSISLPSPSLFCLSSSLLAVFLSLWVCLARLVLFSVLCFWSFCLSVSLPSPSSSLWFVGYLSSVCPLSFPFPLSDPAVLSVCLFNHFDMSLYAMLSKCLGLSFIDGDANKCFIGVIDIQCTGSYSFVTQRLQPLLSRKVIKSQDMWEYLWNDHTFPFAFSILFHACVPFYIHSSSATN